MTVTFFWCRFGFGKCFRASSQCNYWASHCLLWCTIYFLLHVTMYSRNGSLLLHRIKEYDISKLWFFFICSQVMRHPWQASLVAQRLKCMPAMQETWVWSLDWEDPLEKEMATYSSTLAWKISWMEKPGRLQPMGFQRVRYNFHFHEASTYWVFSPFQLEASNAGWP